MPRFPLLDAALEGFRLTRERPWAVAAWAAVILVVNLVTLAGVAALGLGPALADASPLAAAAPSPEAAEAVRRAGVWLPMLAMVQVGGCAVLYAAVMRAVLEPGEHRFGYLRLGWQELRQAAVWTVGLLLLASYGVLLGQGFQAVAAAPEVGRFAVAAAGAGVFLALFYPLVRLSLAPAATFARRRIVLFGAWPLSRGVFWSLVGCQLVATALAAAVGLLTLVATATLLYALSLATGAGADLAQALDTLDVATLPKLLTPAALAAQALRAVLTALVLAILAAPAPVILTALSGPPSEPR